MECEFVSEGLETGLVECGSIKRHFGHGSLSRIGDDLTVDSAPFDEVSPSDRSQRGIQFITYEIETYDHKITEHGRLHTPITNQMI